jgi:hypothetical protein
MWVTTILAIFFNTFINPIALDAIGWKYYFVFVVVCAAYGVTAFIFYPETRGYSLEQMAVIFDGDEADVPEPSETFRRVSVVKGIVQEKQADVESHVEVV